MLYTVKCHKCRLDYNLEGKYLTDKKEISCPNCEDSLSEQATNELKTINAFISENSVNIEKFLVRVEGAIKPFNNEKTFSFN